MRVSVLFELSPIGNVLLDNGKLRFPEVPEAPGIYRFEFQDRIYIGETDRLRRRFQHYRNPGPSQSTNIRINQLMVATLEEQKVVSVSTIDLAKVNVGGNDEPLDLSMKTNRLLVESALLSSAQMAGQLVVNL